MRAVRVSSFPTMSFIPLLVGLAATLVAAFQLAAWIALGSRVLPRGERGAVGALLALLVGASATGAMLAVLAYAGQVPAALAALLLVDAVALAAARRRLAELLTSVRTAYAEGFAGRRWATAAGWAVLALYWLDSIVPARDADVMRYHLAHVQQILTDGRWVPLPDYHYALPFGWSLNYLGFEWLGLPQAAHLANLGVWLLVVALVLEWFREAAPAGRVPATALLALGTVALQAYVVKAATTAHADAYAIAVFAAAAALALRAPPLGFAQAAFFGFAAAVGAQGRYQLVGVGLAAALFGTVQLLRKRAGWAELRGFALGGGAALALALPFYLANWGTLGNPVWPLMVRRFNGLGAYRDRVAEQVNAGAIGRYDPGYVARSVRALFTDLTVFPLPLLVAAACTAALLSRDPRLKRVGGLTLLFLLVWVAMQPSLYPRFVMIVTAAVPLALGPALAGADARPVLRRVVRGGLGLLVAGSAAVTLFYSLDSLRYVATGDTAAFHRATWYYPVYRWANAATPRDARFLVIVSSGQTYYLDRPYRAADPYTSGVVDWDALRSPDALYRLLARGGYSYVMLDRRDWSPQVGGGRMMALIAGLQREGRLVPVRDFHLQLVTSRIRNQTDTATVSVLRVASPPPSSASPVPMETGGQRR
jgi:hypothetical protein